MAPKVKAGTANIQPKFVTAEELDTKLDKFGDKVLALVESIEKKIENSVVKPEVSVAEKAIEKAGPNKFTTNEVWDEEAKKIIGEEYVDHTEVYHEATGGIKFTVVIKTEKSNAGQMYLEQVKTDRRTKEVGSEGLAGVQNWCTLIKQNLARPSAANQRNN